MVDFSDKPSWLGPIYAVTFQRITVVPGKFNVQPESKKA
jgi:hypothetical protein